MSRTFRDPIERQLDEARGYLMLELPAHALEVLEKRSDWGAGLFEACLLKGEVLRELGRLREAMVPLEKASSLRPEEPRVALLLGWCFKRTNRLAQAIDVLERSSRSCPSNPLLHYNLACYWSLAGNTSKAFEELTIATQLEPRLRRLIQSETDFDRLRGLPEFEQFSSSTPIT